MLAAVTGIIIIDDILSTEAISASYVQWTLTATIIVLLVLVAIVQFRTLAHRVLSLIGKAPLIGRFEAALHAFYTSSYEILKLRHLIPTVMLGMIGYLCDGLAFYLVLTGLGEPHSLALAAQAIFMLGFSVIIAAISAMPGGAGGRELTIGAMLTAFIGMPRAAIGVAVLLAGINQIWFGTVLGLIVIAIFRKRLFTAGLQEDIEAYEEATSHHDTSPPQLSIFS